MKIKMTETVQGSLDGVTVQELKKDQEYDTADSPRGERMAKYHVETMGQAIYAKAARTEPTAPDVKPAAGKARK